jgi:hypothetical protein
MHLRDRGGGDSRTKARKQRLQRLAEGALDRGLGLRLREGRHAVLQALQVARENCAHYIWPRRKKLTELDIARSKPRQRRGKPPGAAHLGRPLDHPRQPQHGSRRQRQRRRIDQRQHAFARQDKTRAGKAEEMGEGVEHRISRDRDYSRQPECSATMPPVSGQWRTRANPARRIIAVKTSGLGNLRIDSTR